MNRDGQIVLHVPRTHVVSVFREERGGFLRARIVEADPGQPSYTSSPLIHGMSASTVGGTTDAVHAELVPNEPVGSSDGTPGQRFRTLRAPVLAGGGPVVLESTSEEGWEEWTEVTEFADSGSDDRHYAFDPVHGEIMSVPL